MRLYHHADWLHFEVDQSRDAIIVSSAIQDGPGSLPLQGPRAAGSFLRLGPGFYYLQYVSALVFGNTPSGITLLTTLLSIGAIPMAYLLMRRVFSRTLALFLASVVAFSPFFVLYGRFSWNPNMLPFLILMGVYALLRAVDTKEKNSICWLGLAAIGLGLATHMHFLALVIIGISVVVFLGIKRPKLPVFAWVAAVGVVFMLYTPLIINDVLTGGENVGEFTEAITGKTDDSKHGLVEKMVKNFNEQASMYATIVTGNERVELFTTRPKDGIGFDIVCAESCRQYFLLGSAAAIVFAFALVLLGRETFMGKQTEQEKDFFLLHFVWLVSAGIVYTPIAFDIAPRFFLPLTGVILVLLGLILRFISSKGKIGMCVFLCVSVSLVLSCLYWSFDRLTQLERSQRAVVKLPHGDRILKERTRATYGQQRAIAEFMMDVSRRNGYPIFFHGEIFYKRSIGYILDTNGVYNASMKTGNVYRKGNYFLVYRTDSDTDSKMAKYLEKFDLVESKIFGTLTVFIFIPKQESITDDEATFSGDPRDFSSLQESSPQKRYIWSEFLKAEEGSEE